MSSLVATIRFGFLNAHLVLLPHSQRQLSSHSLSGLEYPMGSS